ncbi:hypothetical protein O3G_MSEX002185 [Manduca sexta]|nr:hypothetical protein O3G_MSEX002185 [Manduca sexta]
MVFTNSSLNDISTECQSLNIKNDTEGDPKKISVSLKKNAKRKERLKQLKIPPPQNSKIVQSQIPEQHMVGQQANITPQPTVHDFFLNQVNPQYVSSSSRYLENLCHHPQFQYSANTQQLMQESLHHALQASSVPVTPIVFPTQNPYNMNIPISPIVQSEPNTPRYVENALKHPLLSHSMIVHHKENFKHVQNNFKQFAGSVTNNSPKGKQKAKKKDNNGDNKFEPYISADSFESGLKNNTLLEGVLRINPKQFQHSYVSSSNDRSEQDVLIDGVKHRNRALEGDVVIVQLIDNENDKSNDDPKQKRGKVVYIKEKVHPRTCIGTLKLMADKNRQKALFVPRDHRVPRLNIPFTSWPDNFYYDSKSYENTMFLARILDWTDVRFAVGIIVCNIGQLGDMMSETKAILAQNDLDVRPYGPEVREYYPSLDYIIPEEEIKLREDCRQLCVFSIDPFNCRDIDDAMSCKELEDGNFEVGVHISDVAHFLKADTILDKKVALKATTIYLVEKAYHMLPDELCTLCSLLPGIDKLAFSVFWVMTKDAQVLSHRFAKTVIRSCSQLAYEHAQAILEDHKDAEDILPETYNGFNYKDISKTTKILGELSAILRKNRFESGALRIDQPKISFRLNPSSGLPESFNIYVSQRSHQLIEEFMLLANMTVANRIHDDHPDIAFLRCHPPPSSYMMRQLAKSLEPMGINLDISSAGDLYRSLLPYVGPENTDVGKAMVLNMLCAKPMTRAKYFCAGACDEDGFQHYALNVPLYTHFTSPIRRYADVMVHRLLAASLKYREIPRWSIDKVRSIAAQCNKQKYNAKKAAELSTELYTLKYIEMNSPLEMEAAVVEIKEKYIDVIIVAMGLNRRIFFNNDFPGEYRCIKNEGGDKLSKMELTWHATGDLPKLKQVIEVFSILKTELHKGEDILKVETKLKRPQ